MMLSCLLSGNDRVLVSHAGVVDAVNKLPLIGGLLEVVGLIVTGWFGYRYLVFGPDRQVRHT